MMVTGVRVSVPLRRGKLLTQTRDRREGEAMADLLGEEDIAARLEESQWHREDAEIVREWRLEDFAQAMEFVNQVADAAEQANHHPDILIYGWNKVKLSLTNHSAGGLTEADFAMADRIDRLG
jgi:4a-hydroxytetrahydrobiopterin dehydratase